MNDTIFNPEWYQGRLLYEGGAMTITDRGWSHAIELTASPLIAKACSAEDQGVNPVPVRLAPWVRIINATGADDPALGLPYEPMPLNEWQKILAIFEEYGGHPGQGLGDLMNYGPADPAVPWPWETIIDYRASTFMDNHLGFVLRQMMVQNLGYDGFLVSVETDLFQQHPGYGPDPDVWGPRLAQAFKHQPVVPVLVVFNEKAFLRSQEPVPEASVADPFPGAFTPSPAGSLAPALVRRAS